MFMTHQRAPIVPKTAFIVSLCLSSLCAQAAPFSGPDFSGVYDCLGNDSHEGAYTGTVTLERVPAQSDGEYGAYDFQLEVPGYGVYTGEAAAHGMRMGIHFALSDPSTQDFGTGIADFEKTASGKWRFRKFYYEPAYKGGNFGTEDCTQR